MAPEDMRIVVKFAASMLVVDSATRHSKEFPAKAIIAMHVMMERRTIDIAQNALASPFTDAQRPAPRARSEAERSVPATKGLTGRCGQARNAPKVGMKPLLGH